MHKFSLETPVEEMEESDLRSTLDEFMEKHGENVGEYESLTEERDQFSEAVEELEGEVEEQAETFSVVQAKFAEIVAEGSPLFDAEEVADRFSLEELIGKADALGAFSLEVEDVEDDEEGSESKFADKPPKAPVESEGNKFSEEVESDLKAVLGGF